MTAMPFVAAPGVGESLSAGRDEILNDWLQLALTEVDFGASHLSAENLQTHLGNILDQILDSVRSGEGETNTRDIVAGFARACARANVPISAFEKSALWESVSELVLMARPYLHVPLAFSLSGSIEPDGPI